jgi:hypothetical protein
MAEGTHVDMHKDHRQWASEMAMWREDVNLWEEECRKALAQLSPLEIALRQYAEALDDHRETTQAHEGRLKEHEHALAEFERGKKVDELTLLRLAKTHREEAERHGRQRGIHERLKRHHYTMMAHWALLFKEIAKPEQSKD